MINTLINNKDRYSLDKRREQFERKKSVPIHTSFPEFFSILQTIDYVRLSGVTLSIILSSTDRSGFKTLFRVQTASLYDR
jgi:hypothetical protein